MCKSLLPFLMLLAAGAVYAAPAQSTGAMFEALGIPKDRVREAWNTPELKLRAGQWHDAKLRFESGNIGIYEVWDRELAALRALMSQPEVAASPLMPELIRAYSKRLQQQLDMLKLEYESGWIGLEQIRKKELEIYEFRKRHGLAGMPPPEQKKTARVAPPSFTDGVRTWESLISRKGCLVSATDVGFTTEGSIFAAPEWREFFDKAKRNGVLFRFIVDKFSSERPTEIHICNFGNATEGELSVFAAQRIVKKNWYAYDGNDDELKRITGQDAAAKVRLLKSVLKNDRTRAALQNYFVREYERMVGATVAPSPVGKWALFACERTSKSRMPTSLTVFADGRYESRTSKGTTVEIVRGTWRQDGADVHFTDSGKEFRNRFDNTGRLVPDGQDELHKNGCKLFFERETVVKSPAPSPVGGDGVECPENAPTPTDGGWICPSNTFRLDENQLKKNWLDGIRGDASSAKRLYFYYDFLTKDQYTAFAWLFIGAKLGDEVCEHNFKFFRDEKKIAENRLFVLTKEREKEFSGLDDGFHLYCLYMHYKQSGDPRKADACLERLKKTDISPLLLK